MYLIISINSFDIKPFEENQKRNLKKEFKWKQLYKYNKQLLIEFVICTWTEGSFVPKLLSILKTEMCVIVWFGRVNHPFTATESKHVKKAKHLYVDELGCCLACAPQFTAN